LKGYLIKSARILFFLATGLFFLFIAFRNIPLETLMSGLRSARYEWVFLSLSFATLAFISRAVRWVLLIEPLGYNPSVKNTFYALMTGYLANFIFPRIGEITRCGSLNRTDRIPVDTLLGTVIIDRLADILVLFLLSLTVFLMKIDLFGNFIFSYIIRPLFTAVSSLPGTGLRLLVPAVSAIILLLILYLLFAGRLRKHKASRKIEEILKRVAAGMKSVIGMEKKLWFLLHTIFIWFMYFLMTWAVFMALPATMTLGAADALFILVIGGLGMVAPVQGGIGTYHWIVSVGLTLYGIPREEGLVFATLSHESQALLMILLGSFSMLMVFLKWKKTKSTSRDTLWLNQNN
jgi:glycosyltransferase 2 family protein